MSQVVTGHWDETARPDGAPSPAWQQLMASLHKLGRGELLGRWEQARRLLEENGVTYNVYGDPRGIDRPWQLDAVPMLLDAKEWTGIEAAVSQRATLLDRMLADLYGPQRLLRSDMLPPELVFAHPGFLRACHGLSVPRGRHLHVYAADLARSPDGQWWVIADRTQAPSGAGYALENRVVMSRVMPELFREFPVRRLANYFQTYRDALHRMAPEGADSPRIVLMTPGPYNETFFEHAYLARYLGLTLVEGADLTVRDDRVFLKTLSGLQQVDVILRRQDAHFCDPLELWGESALGVPGLVQAVRSGRVTIANALGSGLVETAATMAFLPGLCRELLGEPLRMPSVATWWCGQQAELDYTLANLAKLVLKPAFPGPQHEIVFGGELSAEQRQNLVARIRAHPHRWVAQEKVALSTVPTGDENGLQPRHMVLRVYAVSDGEGWSVLPGGLTRVSSTRDSLVVSSQRGGASKDTWVLAHSQAPYTSLLPSESTPSDVSRSSFSLTSRVAESLLWLGRSAERVEASVRLFRAAIRALADEPLRSIGAPAPEAVELLEMLHRLPVTDEDAEPPSLEDRVFRGLFDREDVGSLASAVSQVHRLAWQLRDRISPDAWRVLARLDQEFVPPVGHPALRVSATLDLLDETLLRVAAFTGLVVESMTRQLEWQFLEVGRRIERGIQIVELLQNTLVEEIEDDSRCLEVALVVADSSMTYRSRYRASLTLPLVLDLLLVDELNPRSVGFQLVGLEERLRNLERAPHEDLRLLLARVRETPLDELVALQSVPDAPEAPPRRLALERVLADLAAGLPALANAINHAYLSHALQRRQGPGFRSGDAA